MSKTKTTLNGINSSSSDTLEENVNDPGTQQLKLCKIQKAEGGKSEAQHQQPV